MKLHVLVTNKNVSFLFYLLLKGTQNILKKKVPEIQGRAINIIYMKEEMYLPHLSGI